MRRDNVMSVLQVATVSSCPWSARANDFCHHPYLRIYAWPHYTG